MVKRNSTTRVFGAATAAFILLAFTACQNTSLYNPRKGGASSGIGAGDSDGSNPTPPPLTPPTLREKADCDSNGLLDSRDMHMIKYLQEGRLGPVAEFCPTADLNNDGSIDEREFDELKSLTLDSVPGDCNEDGVADSLDREILDGLYCGQVESNATTFMLDEIGQCYNADINLDDRLTFNEAMKPTCHRTATLCGDYDADGKIAATDALGILRAVGSGGKIACRPEICDVNNDGAVNSTDGNLVFSASTGISVTLSCPNR